MKALKPTINPIAHKVFLDQQSDGPTQMFLFKDVGSNATESLELMNDDPIGNYLLISISHYSQIMHTLIF